VYCCYGLQNFRTVDPCIYAVSDYTKFSRVYRDDLPHHRYNPREVGIYVALQVILQHLHPQPEHLRTVHKSIFAAHLPDPAASPEQPSALRPLGTLHKIRFSLPRSYTSLLPGDLVYFHSALPKPPQDRVSYLTDNATVMVGLFEHVPPRRVTLLVTDVYGTVSELVYAGLDDIEPRNLSLLPGKHEAYLNSAVHAHQMKHVYDWIEFFRSRWATVLYQDNFPNLMNTLKKNLQSDKGMIMLLSRIFEKAEVEDDIANVAKYRRSTIGAHGELAPEVTRKVVEAELLEYVRENKDFLPELFVPTPGH
jgi:hypothetical protein